MNDVWEAAFAANELMWGRGPTRAAQDAAAWFAERDVQDVLILGIGYGRNAAPFLEAGMNVTGIEISATAIGLASSELGLTLPIHHGSVTDMPFDDDRYDGIFCHALIHLFDAAERAKVLADCYEQLRPGGHMVFTLISTNAPMFGKGAKLGDSRYEVLPNIRMYFYTETTAREEFGRYGLVKLVERDEPFADGASLPFLVAHCTKS